MRDIYPDLDVVKELYVEGRDYRIRWADRISRATILSPHGGFIEPGTSAIVRAIAGRRYNYFDFQGLSRELWRELHITSTKFRDPDLMRFLEVSEIAVSIHGMGSQGADTIWLGGRNKLLKSMIQSALERSGFAVDPHSPRYKGESPLNVVNLAVCKGVQLEIPDELMEQLFVGAPFAVHGRLQPTDKFHALVAAITSSLRLYWTTPGADCSQRSKAG